MEEHETFTVTWLLLGNFEVNEKTFDNYDDAEEYLETYVPLANMCEFRFIRFN